MRLGGCDVAHQSDDSLRLWDALEQRDVEKALIAFRLPKDASHFVGLCVHDCKGQNKRSAQRSHRGGQTQTLPTFHSQQGPIDNEVAAVIKHCK